MLTTFGIILNINVALLKDVEVVLSLLLLMLISG